MRRASELVEGVAESEAARARGQEVSVDEAARALARARCHDLLLALVGAAFVAGGVWVGWWAASW